MTIPYTDLLARWPAASLKTRSLNQKNKRSRTQKGVAT